jgi:hypothetical protein
MKAIEQTLQDFEVFSQQLSKLGMGWQPTPLLPVKVITESHYLDLNQVKEALKQYTTTHGWLLLPSQLLRLPAAISDLTAQPPLSAEGVSGELTWQLSYLGQQRWLLAEHRITQCEAAEATHLAEEIAYQAVEPALKKLRYFRLWRVAEQIEQLPQLELAVFIGFTGVVECQR